MRIVEIIKSGIPLEDTINYYWQQWGNEQNRKFYADCITHSAHHNSDLPKFYLCIDDSIIIGSVALLRNDIISRQDLCPWLACLFVEQKERNKGIAEQLINHAKKMAKELGYQKLFLSTDLEGFYEKKGWTHMGEGYNIMDEQIKIYQIDL